MRQSNKAKTIAILSAAASSIALDAAAQSLADEIVVTATRRESSVQDVGISVSAYTGAQLRDVGIADSTDIIQITPGLQNPQAGSGATSSFSIRGVTQTDFGFSQEAPVALYLDDVYQANQGGAAFQLFDIERVEVLRGPQGTLFGRNATGGLVHFITNKPSQETGAYGEFSYGSYDRVKAEAAVGGALSESLSVRASGIVDFHDDIVENRTGPDVRDKHEYGMRLQALFEPGDDFEFLISGRFGKRKNDGTPYSHRVAFPTGFGGTGEFATAPGATDFFGFAEPDNDPFTVSIDPVSVNNTEAWGVTGTLNWDFGGAKLTTITDYSHLDVFFIEDSDIQPGEFFHFRADVAHKQFSQELRLAGDTDRMRWTLGAYYLNIRGDFDQRGLITDLGFGVDQQQAIYQVDTDSYSVFAQAEFDLTDQLTFTGGARWILDEKAQVYENFFTIDGVPGKIPFGLSGAPNLIDFAGSDSDSIFAARAQLDYNVSDDLLLYASYNRGVKGFGYNAPVDPSGSPLFIDPATFDPAPGANDAFRFDDETLNAFEAGFKSTIADGARLNVSAFYYDYNNYQALNFAGITQIITNNDARMYGVDAELFASPWQGMDLVIGAAYLDTKIEDVIVGPLTADREGSYAPTLSLTGLARQEWALANGGSFAIQANAVYTGDHFLGLTNAAVLAEDRYIIADARISYTFPNDRTTIAFFVNNLTDKEYRVLAFDTSAFFGSIESQFGRPREFGGSISFQF